MNTLFNVRFNWGFYVVTAVAIYWLFPDMSWFSYFALLITLHQFLLLFHSIGYVIPYRYLFGAFMCLHMLLGPAMAYYGLDKYQGAKERMQLPEAEYFSYVIPAVISFILGLHFRSNNLQGEVLNTEKIKAYVSQKKDLPFILIAIGFISSFSSDFFSAELAFVFYLLSSFKFIGVFLLIIGKVQLKILPLSLVYGSVILSSINEGMFHDVLIWLIFLGAVLAIRYKPSVSFKAICAISFILLSISIQLLKGNYREATWEKGEEAGVGTLTKAYEESQSSNKFFSSTSLAQSNLRVNQGYIITHIMKLVPNSVPYAQGSELFDILQSAILPRFLAPNKLKAGSREIFIKYTRIPLKEGTSMALSSIGDAYINFGITGGCIFMFLLGLLFNELLKKFQQYSINYPLLIIFSPIVFFFPIRPDCELQTILGHLFKSCFLIYLIFNLWKKDFKINLYPFWKRFIS